MGMANRMQRKRQGFWAGHPSLLIGWAGSSLGCDWSAVHILSLSLGGWRPVLLSIGSPPYLFTIFSPPSFSRWEAKGTSWLLGPMSYFLNAISSYDVVHYSTLSISRYNELSIDTIMFWIKHLCNLDMRAGRVIKFAISIFLRISRDFGWESCETNLLGRTVGAAFYGVWRLWNQVDNRLHALRYTVGGCILRHLVNTGTNLVNLCYSTDDSVGRRR